MRFSSVVICGAGKVRPENQDNYYMNGAYKADPSDNTTHRIQSRASDQALYAVADGMGGEKHGELASFMTVRAMDSIDRTGGSDAIVSYLLDRNAEICRFIEAHGGVRSGSTFVGLCMNGDTADLVNIGDSRAYMLRDSHFWQISKDHTVVQRMLNMGIITKEQMRTHPERHKLSQNLGIFPDEMIIEPHTSRATLMEGDLFLLCSDGLYEMVEDEKIEDILLHSANISDMATELYTSAIDMGGVDNITVLLIKVESDDNIPIDATL